LGAQAPGKQGSTAAAAASGGEEDSSAAAAPKQARICQEAIAFKEADEDPDEEEPMAVTRSRDRKGTPWIKPGDARPLDNDDEEGGEMAAPKRATICQEAVRLDETSDNVLEETMTVIRSRERKSTPWIKPSDAKPMDDEEEDEEPEVAGPKRATICQEAVELKESTEDDASVTVTRGRARKSTPWIKPGDAQPLDDNDEDEDEEPEVAGSRRATICQEAIESKESAEDNSSAEASASVTRSSARKSTPWIKPGDATPAGADDDDEDEEDSDEEEAAGPKRATICQQAIAFKEDADEVVSVTRRGARKSTPWLKPGDATPHDEEEEDEEEEEEQKEVAPKKVSICQTAVNLKEDSKAATEEVGKVRRKYQRKSTPFVNPGPAVLLDDDEEETEGEHGVAQKHASICQTSVELKEASDQAAGAAVVDHEVVERCRRRKATPWVQPTDDTPVTKESSGPLWLFGGCCAPNRRHGDEDEEIFESVGSA